MPAMTYWKTILKQNFRSIETLIDFLEIDHISRHLLVQKRNFPLNLPKRIAEKIEKNNLKDPLFLQFVPVKNDVVLDGFQLDPVQDIAFKQSDKLLQKYHYRALMLPTSACAMHCRYCFRQNFPYEVARKSLEEELTFIKANPSIQEVILSGGDPLSLDDGALSELLDHLESISHVKIVRFHTRFMIGIPERITEGLLNLLQDRIYQVVFVVHINHPKELDADIINAIKKLARLGIPILSHSVLLKDVNDSLEALVELYSTLIQIGIMPYYLFELDKVKGAESFFVERDIAIKLIDNLRMLLPGYAVPRYAVEIPGQASKTILA
ncbi:MAG: KamA family radical SAM protein [Chlamydiales bacterium]|nr:KamA family radical SAM protein [Chlamydiales bacterium]